MTYTLWTPERDARLLQLVEAGMSDQDIAQELGTTTRAIYSRRYRIAWAKPGSWLNPTPANRLLPPDMPDDILEQVLQHTDIAKSYMFKVETLSTYASQMHDDAKHRIAEEVKVIYDLARDTLNRLVPDMRRINPPACGVEVRVRKDKP